MVFNSALLAAVLSGFTALFLEAGEAAKPIYATFCYDVTSKSAQEELHVGGGLGSMQEWKGGAPNRPIVRYVETIKNKDWYNGTKIPKTAFQDDTLGFYDNEIKNMGASAATHPDELMTTVLVNGFTELGPDGQAFFSASHPIVDGGTQSNLQAGALSATTFREALAKAQGMTDYYGKALRPKQRGMKVYLMVGPTLRATAKSIVAVDTTSSGAGNPDYEEATVIVNEGLTGAYANYWFVLLGDGPVRALVMQTREKPEFHMITDPEHAIVITEKVVMAWVEGRWNIGYAHYQAAVGSPGT